MIDYQELFQALEERGLHSWRQQLQGQLNRAFDTRKNGNLQRWLDAYRALPDIQASSVDFNCGRVRIGELQDIGPSAHQQLYEQLQIMHPWRKGPYQLFDTHIDTEWRSDLKWERLVAGIEPLARRWVLDVGCGNGYHMWRMLADGAQRVIGVDPSLLFTMQFASLKRYTGACPVDLLPVGVDDLPVGLACFDTVFSMGVLYHRRSPIDFLMQLRGFLRRGGELVLETLVIEGEEGESLMPSERYAKMRNVWFIPSVPTLQRWLKRCGFSEVELLDCSPTTAEEQRRTEWMRFESLPDFLDPHDPARTVEGYPGPLRAVLRATA